MTAAYPSWINQGVQQGSYGEQPETNLRTFKPDVGRAKLRRRMSISQDLLTIEQWFSAGNWEDFKYFWRFTLSSGTQPFSWVHPRTGQSATFKFEGAPKLVSTMGKTFVVQYPLRLIAVVVPLSGLLLEDGVSHLTLEDGTSKLDLET